MAAERILQRTGVANYISLGSISCFDRRRCMVLDMGIPMRRREFIGLLGGAAAWPLVARAQQRERMRRIGILIPNAADNPDLQNGIASFMQGLQESGWTIGRNDRIELRSRPFNAERVRKEAAELVALAPDVVLAYGASAATPLQDVTRAL